MNEVKKKYSIKILLLVLEYIKSKNKQIKLSIKSSSNEDIEGFINEDIFFEFGQLLMLFYVFNLDNICKKNIKYSNNTFYINEKVIEVKIRNELLSSSEDIVNFIIDKSVYKKILTLGELKYVNKEHLKDIQDGFKTAYDILIDMKFQLINYIKSFKCDLSDVIENINFLNPNDLELQIKLIEISLSNYYSPNKVNDSKRFIEDNISYASEVLDKYIDKAIYGIGSYGIELMWIGKFDKTIKPTIGINIYVSVLLAYIGEVKEDRYYIQAAKYSINPLLKYLDKKKKNISEVKENKEFIDLLTLLYLLNSYIDFSELDKFIKENLELFSLVRSKDKTKYDLKIEENILEDIKYKALDKIECIIV